MPKKILLVDDDPTLVEGLSYSLKREGYEVAVAADGLRALECVREEQPDLVILDIMLPQLDGFEVCRILRAAGAKVPILMLTAKTEEVGKAVGLELGADDYFTKPFGLRELVARIRALLRRAQMVKEAAQDEVLHCGDLEINVSSRTVRRGDSLLELSPKEFDLLAFLAKNRGQVFSRDALLERVWGHDWIGDPRTVDVHIRWLREKIELDPANPRRILTVRGVGYKFEG
ncbi:MAG: DNA-binding response regulator [Chloroflexi bacterium]|nr:MAG: DNA-binding response regulator [Chloroflexota bacterium]